MSHLLTHNSTDTMLAAFKPTQALASQTSHDSQAWPLRLVSLPSSRLRLLMLFPADSLNSGDGSAPNVLAPPPACGSSSAAGAESLAAALPTLSNPTLAAASAYASMACSSAAPCCTPRPLPSTAGAACGDASVLLCDRRASRKEETATAASLRGDAPALTAAPRRPLPRLPAEACASARGAAAVSESCA
jgi:hypothetical protein